jgi:hypothetical protein
MSLGACLKPGGFKQALKPFPRDADDREYEDVHSHLNVKTGKHGKPAIFTLARALSNRYAAAGKGQPANSSFNINLAFVIVHAMSIERMP